MNNLNSTVLDGLNRAVAALKQVKLVRAFIVVMAACLVFVTTACSPNSPEVSGSGSYNERVGQPNAVREYTDRADNKARPGINSYQDETSRDANATRTKAKELSQRARENVKNVQSPGEFVEEYREGPSLGARTRNVAGDVGEAAENFKEDFAKGTRENVRNLKVNADKAGRNVENATDTAKRNVEQAADNTADAVRNRT